MVGLAASSQGRLAPIRALVGVDLEKYAPAISLLMSLGIDGLEVHLLNVVESLAPVDQASGSPGDPFQAIVRQRTDAGQRELERAEAMLPESHQVHKHQLVGNPAQKLIETADRIGADLICAGSGQKGRWGSLFFGSVAKALTADSRQSILVGKFGVVRNGGMRIVLATDQSPYSQSAMETFLSWLPLGVARATVVTAATEAAESDIGRLKQGAEEYCRRLTEQGIEADHRVMAGDVSVVLGQVMSETRADLLVLGARGHGYWRRVWLGSVAHHQVVATPHNVLVVRVKEVRKWSSQTFRFGFGEHFLASSS